MPTGEKKGTSPPPRMCKRGNRAVPHLKHLGDGTSTLDLSQEKSQTRDPAPHLPVSPDETEPPGKHRRKAPRTTLGSFPAGSCSGRRPSEQDGQCGRRAPGARRTRRVGGRSSRAPSAAPHSPAHGPESSPAAGVLKSARSSGITSGFNQFPGSDVTTTPCARKTLGGGAGPRTRGINPSAAASFSRSCPGCDPRAPGLGAGTHAGAGARGSLRAFSALNTTYNILIR